MSMEAIVADINRTLQGGFACDPFCASDRAAEAVTGDRITIVGPTATSPG